jgi:hypothetical protein
MTRDMWMLAALAFGGWLVFRKSPVGSGLVGSGVPFTVDRGTYTGPNTGFIPPGFVTPGIFGPIGQASGPDTSGSGQQGGGTGIQVDHILQRTVDML